MNPFERWDDWEWERAIQEVGKDKLNGNRRPSKKGAWGNFFKYWNSAQKKSLVAAVLFLLIFFSAGGQDQISLTIHGLYRGAMASGNYYNALNGMAKDAFSLGGVTNKSLAVDAKMKGQFLPPISGPVVAVFGQKGEGGANAVGTIHNGIDVESDLGTAVVSPASGVVSFVGMDAQLGKVVKEDFGDGWTAVLGNLGGISVQKGQRIEKGEVLGTVGLSAPLKKPWLHFELRKNNRPVDPLPYLMTTASKN